MTDHAKRLRETRVDMIGTDDAEHYGHCVAAAKYIVELENGGCRFNCRTNKEAYLAGVLKGVEMAFNLEAPTPEEAWDNWKRKERADK